MRLAAEQPWMLALVASPGEVANDSGKLRSSDVGPRWNLRRCSATQAFCGPMTCGFTAGYRTSLLRKLPTFAEQRMRFFVVVGRSAAKIADAYSVEIHHIAVVSLDQISQRFIIDAGLQEPN